MGGRRGCDSGVGTAVYCVPTYTYLGRWMFWGHQYLLVDLTQPAACRGPVMKTLRRYRKTPAAYFIKDDPTVLLNGHSCFITWASGLQYRVFQS